ncbi:MAG: redoxin family protein [Nanoarchaeota archaeon]
MKHILVFLGLIIAFVSSCTLTGNVVLDEAVPKEQAVSWMTAQLKDVRTQHFFTVDEFKGRIVLVESFAARCQICDEQHRELEKLKEQYRELIVISFDTENNEQEGSVSDYLNEHGFDWLFAVPSDEVKRSLSEDFGGDGLDGLQVPIVLVCEDQTTRMLPFGLKDADRLKEEIGVGC